MPDLAGRAAIATGAAPDGSSVIARRWRRAGRPWGAWQKKFRAGHRPGGTRNLMVPPPCPGRPSRITPLREIIALRRGIEGVGFVTQS